jgi:hypothetical protein
VQLDRPHLFGLIAGLFLAAGLVCAAMLVTRAWIYVHESAAIAVLGSAQKDVLSDLIIWRGAFQVEDKNLVQAQEKWAADLAKVEAFLHARQITNYVLNSVGINEIKSRPTKDDAEPRTVGFNLMQSLQFTSTNAAQVAELGRDAVLLAKDGVLFTSGAPEFLYTKAAQDKVALLAEATSDARIRAEQICKQGRRTLGDMKSARMGVFQITARYSTETTAEGVNDTTSNEKTIRAVVSASFSVK